WLVRVVPSTHTSMSCFSVISYSDTSPTHPVLLSFPTRRSSDLASLKRCRGGSDGGRRSAEVLGSAAAPSVWARATSLWPHKTARDRKSTRLNSSHVKISYAVFCLKKKNIN